MAAREVLGPFPIVLRPKWWLPLYIYGVALMSAILDCEINEARFRYWAVRGHKGYIEVAPGRLRRIW